MEFGSPQFLWLFWLVPGVILFYVISFRRKRKVLQAFGSLELMAKLTPTVSRRKQRLKAVLVIVSLSFLLFALARPQYGKKLRMMKRKGVDIIICMDTSKSMLAEDIKPSRLERAKHELSSLIDKLKGDRVGIVAFAGEAFLECPLTLDYGAAKMFLDILDPDIIPIPGTAIGKAIRVALRGFNQKERKYKVMVLLTDGEDLMSDPIKVAKVAAQEGVRIYTVGIGSPQGAPIPLRDDKGRLLEYKKDRKDQTVMSKLDELTLEKIALLTDGKYYRSTIRGMELDRIYEDISKLEKKELKSRQYSQYEDRYQYFLLVAILALMAEGLLSDRRRKKAEWRGRFA
jgi:Ca-activated chloride channel family protein